jgi:hypothetical protein
MLYKVVQTEVAAAVASRMCANSSAWKTTDDPTLDLLGLTNLLHSLKTEDNCYLNTTTNSK